MQATAAAISSSSGRSTIGTAAADAVPGVAQPHSTRRPAASSSCSSTSVARGRPPGVAAGPQHRGRRQALGRQRLVEDPAHGRRRRRPGRARRPGSPCGRGRPAWSARPRPRPRPASRRRPPPAPPARRTRSGWARGRRRRRGSTTTAARGAGARMKWTCSRTPRASATSCRPCSDFSPCGPLGPPTTTRRYGSPPSAAQLGQRLDGHVGALERLDPARRRGGAARRAAGPRARRAWGRWPGPKNAWSTPGGTMRMRPGSPP